MPDAEPANPLEFLDMESPGTTNRWVAGRGDARSCAKAAFAASARVPRLWVLVMAVALFWTGLVANDFSALGFATGAVFALLLLVAVYGGTYVGLRRRMARQLPPGLVLESEFDGDILVLRGPGSETRLQFATLGRVRVTGAWVILQQRRSGATSFWPAALFPPAELARLQETISSKAPNSR